MDWNIVYVECGNKPFDNFLDFFFFYFSPLVYPLLSVYAQQLFAGTINSNLMLPAVLLLAAYSFIIMSVIVVLRRIIKGFYDVPPHGRQKKMALLSILMLFVPMLMILLIRLYIVPPSFISRDISVDMWHGHFSVPRSYLIEWTLTNIPRPEKIPNEYASTLPRKWKTVPFLNFRLSDEMALKGNIANMNVLINAHYQRLSGNMLSERKESIFTRKMNLKTDNGINPVYKKMPEKDGSWDVYRPQHNDTSGHPDLYVARDDKSEINSMLECTPLNSCAKKTMFAWASFPCPDNRGCGSCTKICTDISQGVEDYNIHYVFNKNDLRYFAQNQQKIKNFTDSFYSP